MRDVCDHPSVVARHVSSAGCQFVVECGELVCGQKLAFALDGVGKIKARVRWSVADRVADRVGVAFDRVLDPGAEKILTRYGRAARRLELEIVV
ncbi:PilZ domain-containing protein [Novosphingobium sp. BW1]|uniref:PilZ domain-containing protein n=1 Tax=Novosphingobium sp. BW1 TaxID=2592621 RepID=UPI0011DE64F2|nr:PilZ domain-containing protein [Novosphingobium sp. BW1]TYC92855.1 PilZ domain-containing protein [Novosphingobium sp. BW1]